MKKIKSAAFVLAAVLLFSGFFPGDSDIYFRISKSVEMFGKVYKEVSLNYVETINPEEFMLTGIKAMLAHLDPYTIYIDSKDQKEVDIMTYGKYGGIGISVSFDDNKAIVTDLIEGYSAQRQGIRIGDVVKKVNDLEINKDNFDSLSTIQKGKPGTTVSLTIQREGTEELLKFVLVREEIEINNISYYGFVPENSKNAYIKLSGFTRTAGDEIKKAIKDLSQKKDIEAVILDLRGNPGGLLDAAVDVSEKFLKKGDKVVSVIGRDTTKDKQEYFSKEEPIAGKIPLAVLVDDGSASASEIVAGAIQDHDRGIIVGTTTFGKGLVQGLIPVTSNSSLKMTTARYYTPSGRCIQRINYSDKNKVFERNGKNKKAQYFTDKKRKVFSAGGIEPDSIMQEVKISPYVLRLLAEGMFFKFATYYYNKYLGMEIKGLDNNKLFTEFCSYTAEQKFSYTSRTERVIEQLKKIVKDEQYDSKINDQLSQVSQMVEQSKLSAMAKYKNEIVTEIREELVGRIKGRKEVIREYLLNDRQFDTAVKLISNKKIYNKLLNIIE